MIQVNYHLHINNHNHYAALKLWKCLVGFYTTLQTEHWEIQCEQFLITHSLAFSSHTTYNNVYNTFFGCSIIRKPKDGMSRNFRFDNTTKSISHSPRLLLILLRNVLARQHGIHTRSIKQSLRKVSHSPFFTSCYRYLIQQPRQQNIKE